MKDGGKAIVEVKNRGPGDRDGGESEKTEGFSGIFLQPFPIQKLESPKLVLAERRGWD